MNVKKIMSIFQSFYVDVSFVKRFEYTQMTFHKESFLLIKEKRRGSLSSFVTQARTMGEKANMDVVLVFSKLSDSEKKQLLQARVPFVDFKGNLFFPPLGLVLNANDTEVPKELTPSEQLTWIAFLLPDGDIKQIKSVSNLLYGGAYALSHSTFLAETDENTSYVIWQRKFNQLSLPLSQHILKGKMLEIWKYRPFVSEFWNDFKNNHDKKFVDPISLYLTLKDDDDPRIEEESEALENMILQYLGEDDAS